MKRNVELNDLFEQLRRRAIEGRPGGRDGFAVLRQHGLHAWIDRVAAQPAARLPRTESFTQAATPSAPFAPADTATIDSSPLIGLCTDMLLSKLVPPTPQELP